MVRESQAWDYAEPQLNQDGEPAVHDITTLLGCIKTPPSDIDLDGPGASIPECQANLEQLSTKLTMLQQPHSSHVAASLESESESESFNDALVTATAGSDADSTACSEPHTSACPDRQIELASPVCFLDELNMHPEYFADLVPQNPVEDHNVIYW